MAWIESHQELARHPKAKKLARLLCICVPQAVGHLHFLWWWALDYAQDGSLAQYDVEDIAEAAGWEGDAQEFVDALVNCGPGDSVGFIEKHETGLLIHDWYDYAGRLIGQRQHAAEQKRRHRELYNNKALVLAIRDRDGDRCRYCGRTVNWRNRKSADGATYDFIDPNRPTTLENVVVACRACNAGKNQRTPEASGHTLLPPPSRHLQKSVDNNPHIQPSSTLTVPNHTVPNHTVPVIPPTPLSPLRDNRKKANDNDDNGLGDAIDFAGRNLSPTCFLRPVEIEKVREWSREGLHGECIKHAVTLAIENGKANFAYIDAICRRWIDSGAKTMKDVEVLEQDFKRQKQRQRQRSRSPTMAEAPAPVIQVLSEEEQERARAMQRDLAEKLSIERAVNAR